MLRTVTLEEIREAEDRLRGVAVRTPLVKLDFPEAEGEVYVKMEGLQPIGSFKLRGAYNKIAQLSAAERGRGVITYSSGNHAQGVAYAARAVGARAVIVMPENVAEIKRRATAALGAEIVVVGPGSVERRQRAEGLAAEFGYVMIPPYDDLQVIAGQATCGLEIVEDLPEVDLVLAPVSGGGLLGGVAAAVKRMKPEATVMGVEPELAADAQESFRTGKLASWPAELTTRTLADGLRTQSLGELNFLHIRSFVDDILTVTEEEIGRAVGVLDKAGIRAEPSGAVAAAAMLFHQAKVLPYRTAVVIMSGGNA